MVPTFPQIPWLIQAYFIISLDFQNTLPNIDQVVVLFVPFEYVKTLFD